MDERGMQCAWCRRRYDAWGLVTTPLSSLDPTASHGICLVCLCRLLDERAVYWRQRGHVRRAARLEEARRAVQARFAGLRRIVPADAVARHRRTIDLLEGLAHAPGDDPIRSETRPPDQGGGRPADRAS